MFAHLEERAIVDGKLPICLSKEATGRADVFDDEVTYAHNNLMVIRRQDLLNRSLAKHNRYEIKGNHQFKI